MSGLSTLIRRLRSRRGNQRVSRAAQRAILGSLSVSLGGQRQEPMRLWRAAIWALLALALYQVQAGVLPHFGPEVIRVEVSVLLVTFAALHLGAIEGAVAAFAIGYVADLFVQGPPGLCRFLAVATWTGVRITSARVGLPVWLGAAAFTFAGAAAYQLGVLGGLQLVAREGHGPGTIAWISVVPQAALSAAFAIPLHAALQRLERFTAGSEA